MEQDPVQHMGLSNNTSIETNAIGIIRSRKKYEGCVLSNAITYIVDYLAVFN